MTHAMLDFDLLARGGLAALLGVVIGLERQWRERMAGLQTMALVSMGSALFVIFSAFAFPGADPTRVAAQIVSGIGFLGAGVIIKQGMAVTGLNTAATLWATAAVGSLAGAWMWKEAIAGAAIIVVGNLGLHRVGEAIESRRGPTGPHAAVRSVDIVCSADAERDVRQMLLAATEQPRLRLTALTTLAGTDQSQSNLRATLVTRDTDRNPMIKLTRRLCSDPRVTSVRWFDDESGPTA